jgi:GNAT superfamily N-acetyltransferase
MTAPLHPPGGSEDAAQGSRALAGRPVLPAGTTLDLAEDPDEAWLAAYRYRGQPASPVARRVLTGTPVRVFASVRAPGVVAVARGTVTRGAGGTWAGITAVDVDPAWRRRGLARALLGALADWARGAGADAAYLQVARDNAGAVALYESSGFTHHHRYAYRLAPA